MNIELLAITEEVWRPASNIPESILFLIIYFFPSIIALCSNRRSEFWFIFYLNLFVGLSVIGWFIALHCALKKEIKAKKKLPIYTSKFLDQGADKQDALSAQSFSKNNIYLFCPVCHQTPEYNNLSIRQQDILLCPKCLKGQLVITLTPIQDSPLNYHHFNCPNCAVKLKIPQVYDKTEVRCTKCSDTFYVKP